MNEESNLKLVQSGYEKFGSGDVSGLLELFSDSIGWKTPTVAGAPFSGSRRGLQAVGEFFSMMSEAEEFQRFEPLEFIAKDDKVVVLGELAAKVKATGRTYETEWVHIFHIRNDKITEFKEFFDTAAAGGAFQKASAADA